MPFRITTLFGLTTSPTQPADAQAHSAGWSESFWSNGSISLASWLPYATMRANLLPSQAQIIGFRQQTYTIDGNKLLPGGSQVFKRIVPGASGLACDVPQLGLELSGQGAGVPNTSRFVLRGIPDGIAVNGEYTPTPAFKNALSTMMAQFIGAPPYGFIGRDLSQVPQRVVSINAGVLTTGGIIAGVVNGSTFVRLHRVMADDGDTVSGTFLVTAGAGTAALTLQGLAKTVSKSNGTARLDKIAFIPYGAMSTGRILVKKVGRPSSSYRGRASKRK